MRYLNYIFLLVFLLALMGGVINFFVNYSIINETVIKAAISSVIAGERYDNLLAEKRAIELAKDREIRLILVGDIMLDRGVAYQIKKHDDFNYPFLKVADFLNSADLIFGNLEGPISDQGKNQGSVYSFRFDPKVAESLRWAGFDVVSIANNHILDYGSAALLDTRFYLETNGIQVAGAGNNYEEANEAAILEVKSKKAAFLAYTNLLPKGMTAKGEQTRQNFEEQNLGGQAGVSDFNVSKIKAKIEELRKEVDLVVVSMHWGEEYQSKASLSQQKIAHEFIDAGADLVVGHHPHVPQEIEQYKNSWIIYSLGNFIFDQNFSEETMGGLAAEVKIKDGKIDSVEPIKIEINSTFQPYFPDAGDL